MENGDIEMDIKWDNVIYLQQEINEYCSIKRLLSIYRLHYGYFHLKYKAPLFQMCTPSNKEEDTHLKQGLMYQLSHYYKHETILNNTNT